MNAGMWFALGLFTGWIPGLLIAALVLMRAAERPSP